MMGPCASSPGTWAWPTVPTRSSTTSLGASCSRWSPTSPACRSASRRRSCRTAGGCTPAVLVLGLGHRDPAAAVAGAVRAGVAPRPLRLVPRDRDGHPARRHRGRRVERPRTDRSRLAGPAARPRGPVDAPALGGRAVVERRRLARPRGTWCAVTASSSRVTGTPRGIWTPTGSPNSRRPGVLRPRVSRWLDRPPPAGGGARGAQLVRDARASRAPAGCHLRGHGHRDGARRLPGGAVVRPRPAPERPRAGHRGARGGASRRGVAPHRLGGGGTRAA